MRILIAHNRYRSSMPSGESRVVDRETAGLTALGHVVAHVERTSDEIDSWSVARKATLPARVMWSESSRRMMRQTIDEFCPDVVHVHNTFPLLTPAVLHACRDAGVPVVATLHNYKLLCANGEFYRQGRICHDCADGSTSSAVRNGCYRSSSLATLPVTAALRLHREAWRTSVSAYMFISAAQRDLMQGLELPRDRVFVKHNFLPAPTSGAEARREHQVAYVGRVDEGKGLPLLMRAWDRYVRRNRDQELCLVIAGAGPLSAEVERWAAGHPRVDVLGLLSPSGCSDLLARSRAVVLPSQWEETFGLVAVEAMAVGTAAVAAGHGSFPELIRHGRDGLLFDPHDADALAARFEEIDEDPARFDAFGRAARADAEARFGQAGNLAQLLQVYRFACDNPAFPGRRPDSRRPVASGSDVSGGPPAALQS